MSRGRARYTVSDIVRICKAVAETGVAAHVKIDIDGNMTMDFTTGKSNEAISETENEWDEVFDGNSKTAIR
jgi:hypothetical protein